MPPYIICLDGLIGAGKSSLMLKLKEHYECYPEPIADWNLLPLLYNDPKLYGFPFQLQVLISQFKQRQQFSEDGLVLVERCPETSRNVFAPLLLEEADLQLYDGAYRRLGFSVDHILYLDVDPHEAHRRIRCRSHVDSQISLPYLEALHSRYLEILFSESDFDVTIVDARRPLDEVYADVVKKISSIFPNAQKKSSPPTYPRLSNVPRSK